ncbi:methyl-accepting chemotaxis protein [bacterium]|nr:methyl-accepting chemotaxis protein [bacterium]
MKRQMSLKAKLLLVLIPLSIVGIGSMAVILYWMSYKGLVQTNDKYATELIRIKADEVDEWQRVKMSQLMIFSKNTLFEEACQGQNLDEARNRLKYYYEQDGMLENLFLAHPDGTIFADAIDGKSVGVAVASFPLFAPNIQKAQQGEEFFGHAGKSPATGLPVVLVTAPVMVEGKLVGIIGCPVELETFSKIYVNKTKIGQTGYIYVADENGVVVAHPDKEQILSLDLKQQDFGREILKLKNGKYSYNWKGVDKAAYFLTSDKSGWIVAMSLADSETYAASRKLGHYATVLCIVIMVLCWVFIILPISKLVVSPMKNIMAAAEAMEKGDLESRVSYTSGDEVGQLAEAFRNMQAAQRKKAAVVECIARGDLTCELTIASERDSLGKSMALMAESLKGMNREVQALIEAAVQGKLSVRADVARHKGDYARIIEGINQTLDAMVNPVREISEVLNAASEKDLTRRVDGSYNGEFADFKNNVNSTMDSLEQAMSQVAEAVYQVNSASDQIAVGSQTLASGASQQASSLEEISSSLEELSSMTRQNADNAKQAQALSVNARDSAFKGGESMTKMTEAIGRIKESSDQTAKIVKTIDEIAFQTNLLALNAAVEAARAGESGKGFAVVAEEVRALAQRSAEAAKNTAQMIEGAVKNAEGGVKISAEMAEALKEIVEHAGKVGDLVSEISAAAAEQAQGIEQITTAVTQMDRVTQSNASSSEQSASAAEELSSQAEELQGMLATFRLSGSDGQRAITHRVERGYRFADPENRESVATVSAVRPAALSEKTERPKKSDGIILARGNGAKTRREEKSDRGKVKRPEEVIPLDESDFKDF